MPGKDSISNMLIMKLLGIQYGIAIVMNGERLMSILCQFLRIIVTNYQEEAENTYFKERNPIKCHLTQQHQPSTTFTGGEIPFKSSFHLTMRHKERI